MNSNKNYTIVNKRTGKIIILHGKPQIFRLKVTAIQEIRHIEKCVREELEIRKKEETGKEPSENE